MQQSIKVGVYDWTKFSNADGFYPDDLPTEWRLSYFSNEFECACLSLEFVSENMELVESWCEDLPETFQLSLACNHIDQLHTLKDLLQQTPVSIRYLVAQSSNSDLLLQIKAQQSLISTAGLNSVHQIISASSLWTPERDQMPFSCVALFPVTTSIRQYRDWVELWLQSAQSACTDQSFTLWLPGSTTDYRLLSECRTLVELMGY